jgi:hypothetical protein
MLMNTFYCALACEATSLVYSDILRATAEINIKFFRLTRDVVRKTTPLCYH